MNGSGAAVGAAPAASAPVKRKILFTLFLLIILTTACSPDESDSNTESNQVDTSNLSENDAEILRLVTTNEELESTINTLEGEISKLQGMISELERFADQSTCQSITLSQFAAFSSPGTTFVVTPSKMGWTGPWTLRSDQIKEIEGGLARSFEFRIDLTPSNTEDPWQEIHSSILAFPIGELATTSFEQHPIDESRRLETSVDFRIPLAASNIDQNDDGAPTMSLRFLCGNFDVVLKTKYISDPALGLPILEKAAWIVLGELSNFGP